jgi:hypothetical protein
MLIYRGCMCDHYIGPLFRQFPLFMSNRVIPPPASSFFVTMIEFYPKYEDFLYVKCNLASVLYCYVYNLIYDFRNMTVFYDTSFYILITLWTQPLRVD